MGCLISTNNKDQNKEDKYKENSKKEKDLQPNLQQSNSFVREIVYKNEGQIDLNSESNILLKENLKQIYSQTKK